MKEIKRDKEKLTMDLSNEKDKYHNEKQKRIELETKLKDLEMKFEEQKKFADANAQRFKE